MDACRQLKDEIERKVRDGTLKHFTRKGDRKFSPEDRRGDHRDKRKS